MSEDHTTTNYQPGRDMFVSTDRLTHWRGCDSAHPECAHPAVAILTDLIAELRDWDSYYCKAAAADIADRAEARLREVQGE